MRVDSFNKRVLFLIGCFSLTQIQMIGFIGISEIALFVLAPFLVVRDWAVLKKHGFAPLVVLALLCLAGGVLSNLVNQTSFYNAARGIASPYAIFAIVVCLHHFLYPNLYNLKWLIFGCAVSGVLSVFVFQYGAARVVDGEVLAGAEATEHVIGYSLFWFSQLNAWLTLPLQVAYLRVPLLYTIAVGIGLPIFTLLSAGGRSAFLVTVISFALIVLGGNKRATMLRIRRNFWLFVFLGILFAGIIKKTYQYAATHGLMGENQQEKYEKQTARGTGALALLMAGRVEFFAGLIAALDRPLIGYGSWPLDTGGYYERFLEEYGSEEDYEQFMGYLKSGMIGTLPSHSQIVSAWTWYGIFGLLLWLYVFYLYVLTVKKNMTVIPQWYGYLALSLPSAVWCLLFSPFGNRISACLVFIVCLFVKAVAERRLVLPDQGREPKPLSARRC